MSYLFTSLKCIKDICFVVSDFRDNKCFKLLYIQPDIGFVKPQKNVIRNVLHATISNQPIYCRMGTKSYLRIIQCRK